MIAGSLWPVLHLITRVAMWIQGMVPQRKTSAAITQNGRYPGDYLTHGPIGIHHNL